MSSPVVVHALRKSLKANAFRVVPVRTGLKRPYGDNWVERARMDGDVPWPDTAALSTGILCDGLVAVDVDIDDASIAGIVIQAAQHFLGSAPMRTRRDSSRVLMLYRASAGEPAKRSMMGTLGKMEALGRGQQFVAFGNHPDGAAYEWSPCAPDTFSRAKLPAVSHDALSAFLEAVAPYIGAEPPARPTTRPEPPSALPSEPQRASERDRTYAAKALEAEVAKLAAMGPGSGRNAALNAACFVMGTLAANGSIDPQEAASALLIASDTNGHTMKHGQAQTIKTIESGISAVLAKPRPLLADAPDISLDGLLNSTKTANSVTRKGKRKVNLVRMDQIEEEAITWLWEGFLPKATLTLLGGAIQAGKSTIAMSLAATVSNGGLWPDGTRCNEPGNVIFWSSEEVVKSVVKPRLMVAGANVARILTIESSLNEHGEPCAFDPAQDIPLLREAISQLGSVALVIIDPLISAIEGDTNKANDVRRSLKPVVDLAEEFNCTVLGIHHMAKNSEGKSTNDRMLGSQAFAAMARIVLVAAKKADSDERVFAISKSNISKDNGGFNYSIEGISFASPKGQEIKTSRVIWGASIQGSALSILADAEGDPNEDTSKLGQAKAFLLTALAHQRVGSKELFKVAREGHGIAEKTLRRAGEALKIIPQHDPLFDGGWSWGLAVALLQPGQSHSSKPSWP